jgi:hypothetical protein
LATIVSIVLGSGRGPLEPWIVSTLFCLASKLSNIVTSLCLETVSLGCNSGAVDNSIIFLDRDAIYYPQEKPEALLNILGLRMAPKAPRPGAVLVTARQLRPSHGSIVFR